jgi:arsenite-transporting ATPase
MSTPSGYIRSVRVVLMMGKGGVGKTTLSAATALKASALGHRTLLVSTDAAHSLADALDVELGADPVNVIGCLDAVQLDGRYELERSWPAIAQYAHSLLGMVEISRLHAEELLVVPGLDQLLALSRLRTFMTDGRWESVVVDCAPSADSLRLLSLPEVLDWYASRLFGRDGTVRARVRRTLERTLSINAPSDEVVASVTDLSRMLAELRRTLVDADTTARLVITPERLVIAEAQRTTSYLALYGYGVDALLVNRVIDPDETAPEMSRWREYQRQQLAGLPETFGSLTRLVCPLLPSEPIGVDALLDVGDELYHLADLDPLARLSPASHMAISAVGDGAVVRIPVGGLNHGDIDLQRSGTDLMVRLGPYRQAVTLPDGLKRREVVRAFVIDGALQIEFAGAARVRG